MTGEPGQIQVRLVDNLRHGLNILFFRRSALSPSSYTFERVALLMLVNLGCIALATSVEHSPGSMFFVQNALALAAPVLVFALTAYLASLVLGERVALDLCGGFYSALPALLVFGLISAREHDHPVAARRLELLAAAWSFAILVSLCRRAMPRAGALRIFGAAVVGAIWLVPMAQVARSTIWLNFSGRNTWEDDERELAAFFFKQAELLHSAESGLEHERPGVTDLYAVTFAGWGDRVFSHEAEYARDLLDSRFGTSGRSILLSNNASTHDTLPAASPVNLDHVLGSIGARMNREEDILFLFLTSHGSSGGLGIQSASMPNLLRRDELTPLALRSSLDKAGIKWRVIVIAGCESGVFVAPLQNEFTLLTTAAAINRNSFGCAPENEFTEFGRAIFSEQLGHEKSFVAAFTNARDLVTRREIELDLKPPSLPQLFVGSEIAAKLHALEIQNADAGN